MVSAQGNCVEAEDNEQNKVDYDHGDDVAGLPAVRGSTG